MAIMETSVYGVYLTMAKVAVKDRASMIAAWTAVIIAVGNGGALMWTQKPWWVSDDKKEEIEKELEEGRKALLELERIRIREQLMSERPASGKPAFGPHRPSFEPPELGPISMPPSPPVPPALSPIQPPKLPPTSQISSASGPMEDGPSPGWILARIAFSIGLILAATCVFIRKLKKQAI